LAVRKRPRKRVHRAFISHSSEDIWVAEQLAAAIERTGAATFLDMRDIAHGDQFKARIRDALEDCDELVALFTPWSRLRRWVWHEIGMADARSMRIVCVFYHVTNADFAPAEGGLGPLDGLALLQFEN
jgi:hypothetical protein